MKNDRLEFKTADELETVFYESFRHCDASVMAALWSEGDVVCIHPGSGAIIGYESVVRSWEHIFSGGGQAEIEYSLIKQVVSDDVVVHLVKEEIGHGSEVMLVLATNVYQRFEQGWLMTEHHGSLVQAIPQGQTLQ